MLRLALLLLLVPALSGAQTFRLGLQRSYPAGTDPSAVALADLDEDGVLDMVVTNAAADSMSIRIGDGKGGFGPRKDYPTGDEPVAVAIGDLNTDGRPEILVVNRAGGTVSLFQTMGHGDYTPKGAKNVGGQPCAIALGDVTGDTRPDAVVVSFATSLITVLVGGAPGLGLTDSSFTIPTGTGPRGVTLYDLNRDGIEDIATANSLADSISLRLSDNAGGFGNRLDSFVNGQEPVAVVFGDLDNSGWVDAITANRTSGTVTVLPGVAQAAFGAPNLQLCEANPSALALADVNHDGFADVTVVHDSNGLVTTLPGNGTATFPSRNSISAGGLVAFGIAVGDLDGDGRRDLVVPAQSNDVVSVMLGNGLGPFGPKTELPSGSSPSAIAVGDLDGNGSPDAAVANYQDDDLVVFLNQGSGTFAQGVHYPCANAPSSIACVDLTGDGKRELILGTASTIDSDSNRVQVLINAGNGTFGTPTSFDTGLKRRAHIALGEVTGDANLDVVVARTNTLGILPGNGAGALGAVTTFPALNLLNPVHLADLDGNGTLDAVAGDFEMGQASVYLGNGAGSFAGKVDYGVGIFPQAIHSGDFNEDGKRDLVVTAQGQIQLLLATTPGTFAAAVGWPIGGGAPFGIDIGDLNEDGDLDALVGKGGSTLTVLYGRGNGTFSVPVNAPIGETQVAVALADVDANGTLDALAANGDGGTMGVALGRQKTRTALSITPEVNALGTQMTIKATVTRVRPDAHPLSGSVRFFDGIGLLGTAPLNGSGVATIFASASSPWYRTIHAEFIGSDHYFGSMAEPVRHLTYVPTVGVPLPGAGKLALAPLGNPARGGDAVRVQVSLAGTSRGRLTLHDVRGRMLAAREVAQDGVVTIASLAPGVYLVKLEQDGKSTTARAVVL